MKQKALWMVTFGSLIVALMIGVVQYIEVQHRNADPAWQIAKEIYKVEHALKEVDEDYKFHSISKVTPFTYTDSERNTIVYYCCQTAYVPNEPREHTGLDMDAIGLVFDISQIQNKKECTVNEYDAFPGVLEDRSYLCWTLSSEISCVIEYDADVISEENILRMAESVSLPG